MPSILLIVTYFAFDKSCNSLASRSSSLSEIDIFVSIRSALTILDLPAVDLIRMLIAPDGGGTGAAGTGMLMHN